VSRFLDTLQQERVIVVIRGATVDTLQTQLQALYEGGLRLFEVTLETPVTIDALASIRGIFPDDALIGVGTVLSAQTAVVAIAAGAKFVVSPVLQSEVYQAAHSRNIPCMLGGMTPTEIYTAYQLGCETVKVFPASSLGVSFIRDLQGPLRDIPLFATGGITLEQAELFLQAGAVAIGVGSALMRRHWIEQHDWPALKAEAKHWALLKKLQT
jgi:2-dehydro-3-deoxyphosphogluconate aldolase/(4S)-4-hydroxy-2-oxoglutarate aldolase